MNGVTEDAAVCVDVNSSVVAPVVEGSSLVLAVEVFSKVDDTVVTSSVLTVEVSMGRIISTTNMSHFCSRQESSGSLVQFWGSPRYGSLLPLQFKRNQWGRIL